MLRSSLLMGRQVAHGFSTREGGVSVGALNSLNLAARPDERAEHLAENWRRALEGLAGWAIPQHLALMSQVHGARVCRVSAPAGPLHTVGEYDGAVTAEPGLVLAVRTADCVPVLFSAPGGVGVAHAGWRGVAAGVIAATVAALCELVGCSAGQVVAVVGPHIGPVAYETGDEVVEALVRAGVPREVVAHRGPRRLHTDLGASVAWQLRAEGVGAVDAIDLCTAIDPRFFSHRRDGAATGRLAGMIGRLP